MSATDYLVACGAAGVPGRYRLAAPAALPRGQVVVVESARGLELGEVLRPAGARATTHYPEASVGKLLRPAQPADLGRAAEVGDLATRLLTRAAQLARDLDLPVEMIDAEVLLDGEHAWLSYVGFQTCDIRHLVAPLSREFGLTLRPHDLTAPTQEANCGSGGCGSGGCGTGGCGTGGCGSGGCAAPDREELRAYFAGMRQEFENRRRRLL
ncbi:MAG: hypothetical protein U0840_09890 [Gemmataceae bacterium]